MPGHRISEFPRLSPVLRGMALAAATLLPAASGPAAGADLASLTFKHAPNNPNIEGWVSISLDNAGNWTQVETAVVPWRFSIQAVWNEPPSAYYFINLHIKPASLPAPPVPDQGDCGGNSNPCVAVAPSPGGYVVPNVLPHLNSPGVEIVSVTAPLGQIDIAPGIFQDVASACYLRRKYLLDHGRNLHDLLADGFTTDGTDMVAILAAAPGGQFEIPIPFKVRCKGDPNIAEQIAPKTNYQGAYAVGYQLSEATFNITPGFKKGLCPMEVIGLAVVEGNGAGAFRYRLEFDSGKASHWSNASLQPKAGGGFSRVLQIPIPLPLPAAQGSGSGGIVNQQPGSGLAIQQQPEEPVFPGSGGPSTPKQVTGIQEADNVHKGAARLVVSKPDGSNKVASPFDSYHVVCDKPKTTVFSGPKTLQVQPKTPQPTAPATPQLRVMPQAAPAAPQRIAPQPQRVN